MNKKKKDFMNQLINLDDFSVEEIAEKYPALNRSTKRRILKQCMKKDVFSAETGHEGKEAIIVSGTERYNRKSWYKFVASAAAFVIAIGGITSVFMLNRNLGGHDISETEKTSDVIIPDSRTNIGSNKITATSSNSGYNDSCENTKPEGSAGTTNNNTISFDHVSLNETNWYEHELDGPIENSIEFSNDGFSGHYIIPPYDYTTTDATKIYFTYTQNANEIAFRMGSDTATGKLSFSDDRNQVMITLVWADGSTEYFYTNSITINSDGSLEYWLPSDDGYTAQPTTTNNNLVSLNGTNWYEYEIDGPIENSIEFSNDGFSGHYIIPPYDYTTADATKIYLTYTQNGDEILFRMGSDTATGKLSFDAQRQEAMMTLVWSNGDTEYFYNTSITPPDNGNGNKTPQTTTEVIEPPVNNSVPMNTTTAPTTTTPTEQKSFLNELYYVNIAGIDGYMGFEFMPDGTLTKYAFDDFGDEINSTIVKTNYEITENQFSFGDIDKKAGTIVNPNDTGSFSVQFSDGLYYFSNKRPGFKKDSFVATKPDTLNGTIWTKYDGDYIYYDYYQKWRYTKIIKVEFGEDGVNGTYYITSLPYNGTEMERIEIPFTYEQNGDKVTFYMEDTVYGMYEAEIKTTFQDEKVSLNISYKNGDFKCLALSGSLDNK